MIELRVCKPGSYNYAQLVINWELKDQNCARAVWLDDRNLWKSLLLDLQEIEKQFVSKSVETIKKVKFCDDFGEYPPTYLLLNKVGPIQLEAKQLERIIHVCVIILKKCRYIWPTKLDID